MKTVQFQAILDGVTKKKDGTLSLKLGTQELDSEETARLFDFGNKQIWVAFAETELTENDLDIPEVLTEFKSDRSPSERLRGVLYLYWDKKIKSTGTTFDTWYREYMEKIINNIKEKLD